LRDDNKTETVFSWLRDLKVQKNMTGVKVIKITPRQALVIFLVLALFLYVPLLQVSAEQFKNMNNLSWPITELLINYQGGFVRRGLLGELAFGLNQLLNLPIPLFFISLFVTLITLKFVCLFFLLYTYKDRLPLILIVILGPSLLMFPVYDELAYFRKEMLFVVLLLTHASIVKLLFLGRLAHASYYFFLKLILIPLLTAFVLVHEIQVVLLPAHLCLTALAHRSIRDKRRAKDYCWYLIPLLFAFLVTGFSGSHTAADRILESLQIVRGHGNAIEAIGWSISDSVALVSQIVGDKHALLSYLYFWLLAVVVPTVFFGTVVSQSRRDLFFVMGSVSLVVLSMLPLYYIGWDYGRWISLTSWSILSVLLAMPIKPSSSQRSSLVCTNQSYVAWMLAIVYVNIFTLPHCCIPQAVVKNGLIPASLNSVGVMARHLGFI
jgi:hypothetical protein